MQWITEERPKIDRIACPWLTKRLNDKDTEIFRRKKKTYLPQILVRALDKGVHKFYTKFLNIIKGPVFRDGQPPHDFPDQSFRLHARWSGFSRNHGNLF